MSGLPLVISRSAKQDLVDIWTFIAQDSHRRADDFIDGLLDRCLMLAENPHAGRKRGELGPGLRSFPVRRYILFYRVQQDELQIVRVLSGYRDLDALF